MKTSYSPKNNPRVIIIQKLYEKFFNNEKVLYFPKHRFKKFIKDVVSGTIERNEILIEELDNCNDQMLPEEIQTKIYSIGKENGYKENLRDWFKLIYEVVFGDENGPRMGFFISFFGVSETKDLIKNKLENV